MSWNSLKCRVIRCERRCSAELFRVHVVKRQVPFKHVVAPDFPPTSYKQREQREHDPIDTNSECCSSTPPRVYSSVKQKVVITSPTFDGPSQFQDHQRVERLGSFKTRKCAQAILKAKPSFLASASSFQLHIPLLSHRPRSTSVFQQHYYPYRLSWYREYESFDLTAQLTSTGGLIC